MGLNSVPYASGVTECRCTYPARRSTSSLVRRRAWVSSICVANRNTRPAPSKTVNKRFFARLTTQGGDNARRTASKECPKRVYRATQHDYAMVAFLHLQEAKLACQAESVCPPSRNGIPVYFAEILTPRSFRSIIRQK